MPQFSYWREYTYSVGPSDAALILLEETRDLLGPWSDGRNESDPR
jgi:hypothetical protein